MKKFFFKVVVISLSLVLFGCGGPTIDMGSDEYDYISKSGKIITYKGEPFTGILTRTDGNGQLWEKETYKEGKRDGYSESYNNGQLWEKITYKEGKRDGYSEYYYDNGQLGEKITYKEGKKDGPYEYYNKNGQLLQEGIHVVDTNINGYPML